ncbi:acetyl- carboxylase acc1 [Cystoisospora suis]|uniref:Acetyl-carboxylase acc1 n=1 Tax=Cystoisospora suis TaxID=483139 RepID=A0A2C6KMM1_9APIC|nr:acetyl- carboxylase acc1 [Cystoisospora suis]
MERGERRLLPVPELDEASKSEAPRSENHSSAFDSNFEYHLSNPASTPFYASFCGQGLECRLPLVSTGKFSSPGNFVSHHTVCKGIYLQPEGSRRASYARLRGRHAPIWVVLIFLLCLVSLSECGNPASRNGVSFPHSSQMVSPGQFVPVPDVRPSPPNPSFSSHRPSQSIRLQRGPVSPAVATSPSSPVSHILSQSNDAVGASVPSSPPFSRKSSSPPKRPHLLSRASPLLAFRRTRSRSAEKVAFLAFPATAVTHAFANSFPSAVNPKLLNCRSRKSLSPDVAHGIRGRPAFFRGEDLWCSGGERGDCLTTRGSRGEFGPSCEGLMTHLPSCVSTAVAAVPTTGQGTATRTEKLSADQHTNLQNGVEGTDPLADYVRRHGGKRVIRRVLIANNGMAATKSIFSMRQWAYMELGDDKLLEFVVMATPEDMRANPEYIRRADKIVEVPGGPNRNNYANVDLICKIASQEKVDAVWPGWGHASENPALPRRLKELGITFIGPSAGVMAALGDKIAANILAQTAGVPSIPWSGDSLRAQLDEKTGSIPEEVFQQATVKSVAECERQAARIGYPLMIKASEGGGGKGIRMVDKPEQLRSAYEQVTAEVPGSPVFMMQLCTKARHIEVQIVGDEYSQAVALSGRDCSTQRRFQKIFEEAPPTTVVPADTMKEMERAAQRLTQSLGYTGAGTVEYLYNREKNKFYFLELNPRLQVEHPVSEGVTGVNLPAAQLQVAMGIPLSRIPDIRLFFGRNPEATDSIDFLKEDHVPIKRHVLAARVTAENPDEGFKPTSGRLDRLEFQPLENVWGYFSVGASGGVHEYADSQFGHIFATGSNREEARKKLVLGLKRVDVRGEIRTPLEYLVRLLENEDFIENRIDTAWLDGLIKQRKSVEKQVDQAHVVLAAVLFRGIKAIKDKEQRVLAALQRGQRYIHGLPSLHRVNQEITYQDQRFKFTVTRTGPQLYRLQLNKQSVECGVREQADGSFIVLFPNARSHKFNGREEPLGLRLQVDGTTVLIPNVFDPSELRSDVTGKLVRYLVPDGKVVKKGEPYAEVEAMKMIMTLSAGETGVISHARSPGSMIATGDILATLELEDPSRVKKIVDFEGRLDLPGEQRAEQDASSAQLLFGDGGAEAEAALRMRLAMDGYEQDIESNVQRVFIPSSLSRQRERVTELMVELFQSFLNVYEHFAAQSAPDGTVDTASDRSASPAMLLKMRLAHSHLQPRIQLVLSLLRALHNFPVLFSDWRMPVSLEVCLKRLAGLHGREYGPICLESMRLLHAFRIAPFAERVKTLKEELLRIPLKKTSSGSGRESFSLDEVEAERVARASTLTAGMDLLSHLFGDEEVGARALEVAVRRHYRAFPILSMRTETVAGVPVALWSFRQADLSEKEAPIRTGIMAAFSDVAQMERTGAQLLVRLRQFDEEAQKHDNDRRAKETGAEVAEARNVFLAALTKPLNMAAQGPEADAFAGEVRDVLQRLTKPLEQADVRLVAMHVPQTKRPCRMFNFLRSQGFVESTIRRDLCPTVPSLMELNSLQSSFQLTRLDALDPNTQAYLALPKQGEVPAQGGRTSDAATHAGTSSSVVAPRSPSQGSGADRTLEPQAESSTAGGTAPAQAKPRNAAQTPQNVFVRRLVFSNEIQKDLSGLSRVFLDLLDVLDRCSNDPRVSATASGHLFVHIVPPLDMSAAAAAEQFKKLMKRFQSEHNERCLRLHVDQIEVKMHLKNGQGTEVDDDRQQVLRLSVRSRQGRPHTEVAEDVPHLLTGDPLAHRRLMPHESEGEPDTAEGRAPGSGVSTETTRTSRESSASSFPSKSGLRRAVSAPTSQQSEQVRQFSKTGTTPSLATAAATEERGRSLAFARPPGDGSAGSEIYPYPEFDRISMLRSAARRAGSTYIYDFLGLLEVALLQSWQKYLDTKGGKDGTGWDDAVPGDLFKVEEFKLSSDGELYLDPHWTVADNKVGMVGFLLTLKTPEYPAGRQMVLVGSDITHQGGSFGVPEHNYFARVSEFSRTHGLPRVYIACNSGARIGLYEGLKDKVRIAWNDPTNPSLGFKYLYLTPEALRGLPDGIVSGHWESAEEGDETTGRRFVLDAIIGDTDKFIGVENLRGSGMIAGETSRAYDETFTLSYVTGRSVGIGAYIVRLAQRTIQMVRGPLLLTGYQALNKLLGREVYASQDQLGGPEVMYRNGISHLVVQNDQEGMKEVLRWLSYTPKTAKDNVGTMELFSADPVDRPVEFMPTKAPYDVRHLLAGQTKEDGTFVSGFFDKGSFKEYLGGWGKSVVVGRARLGGIPFGAIAVETRTTEARLPADPSSQESRESVITHAGQVWFPDSAFKTAQAINDFNRGENLPLLIFANWRGFSGGTRDMFEEVLKFGSMIVDALRVYKQPVFVYIPPHGELRGGSWVVVDPTINPEKMEMFADGNARGGVLEPPGICEIKYRAADQKALMHRLDETLKELDKQLQDCQTDIDAIDLKARIKKREATLEPLYLSVARFYADLHDRPERMKARGVISAVVNWRDSRKFFYWRARRRLVQDGIESRLRGADTSLDFHGARAKVDEMLTSRGIPKTDDRAACEFFHSTGGKTAVEAMVNEANREGAVKKIREALKSMSPEAQKEALLRVLERAN